MADKHNAECAICGKGYTMCYSCNDRMSAPWKLHCDTAEHYKIFQIVSGYTAKVYTKEEAAERFEKVDLSDLNELRDNIKSIIEEIIAVDDAEDVDGVGADDSDVKPEEEADIAESEGDGSDEGAKPMPRRRNKRV